MSVKPLGTKVLIKEIPHTVKSEVGLILDNVKTGQGSTAGTVIAVGPQVTAVTEGDTVYVDWVKGNVVKVDDELRVIIEEEHIVAVLDK